ncbi:MAG: mannose-1-phosphate guanylyltransferase [Prevotellaceae bacterium]|nr:mannose-1-phosphate guanylyltransferase [Candidatus Colivivens equi]
MNHVVIMAGGVGSRFWPMSTPECPKQFIDILGCGRTFIQMTFDRFKGIVSPENVWIVTSAQYVNIVAEQLPEVPRTNILSEPCRRNTAPCIAYVSWKIKSLDSNANIVVTPSDHMVTDVITFQNVIKEALAFTAESDAIVTLGMTPNRPETGYGYIQADYSAPSMKNRNIFAVDQFHEKPDMSTAQEYIKRQEFLWNSGIFIWKAETILQSIRIYQPDIANVFDSIVSVLGTPQEQARINEVFPSCPNISIDYAVLEPVEEKFVLPASFGWSDVGTYGSLFTLLDKDTSNNAIVGNNVSMFDSSNCIVHTADEKRVVIQGLDGYIVSEKDNTLLICKLSNEQQIKHYSE